MDMTEKPKRLAPKSEVIRRLYLLSGNQCAFPDCNHPIILRDGTYVCELCHIHAAEKGGERFDESQTNEDRRSFENLMFMCHDHHVITNDVDAYPPERLCEIKDNHESNFAQGINKLERTEGIQISDSIVATGGTGGASIAAGGGGGAAIGDGARAGDGGQGGRITNFETLDFESLLAVEPHDLRNFGTGGQGAPAVGNGAVAGNGGGGGNAVTSLIDGEMLKRIGATKIQVRVGKGGKFGGQDGQPSGYDLIDDQGNILVSVNAPGGKAGKTPKASADETGYSPELACSDVSDTYIKAAFFANSVEIHPSGLFSVLSGGWDQFCSDKFPFKPQWPIIIHLALGGVRPGGTLKLQVFLIQPDSSEVELESIDIERDNTTSNPSTVIFRILKPEVTSPGLWVFSIRSPQRELTRLPINVQCIAPS
ncbi:hypothetical protein LPL18_014945 [Halomonas sp. CUBES01]|uniref:DUF6941 family protein n=1 Tax=Halomonas sp. CUBES01 TaxID=2897340 RepID=UPI001E55AA9B|nr:hypothetical protein [Halomonas sp. CUBES01]MEC4768623.1 hypothetical protein [Halomonas sp. CUBES01]